MRRVLAATYGNECVRRLLTCCCTSNILQNVKLCSRSFSRVDVTTASKDKSLLVFPLKFYLVRKYTNDGQEQYGAQDGGAGQDGVEDGFRLVQREIARQERQFIAAIARMASQQQQQSGADADVMKNGRENRNYKLEIIRNGIDSNKQCENDQFEAKDSWENQNYHKNSFENQIFEKRNKEGAKKVLKIVERRVVPLVPPQTPNKHEHLYVATSRKSPPLLPSRKKRQIVYPATNKMAAGAPVVNFKVFAHAPTIYDARHNQQLQQQRQNNRQKISESSTHRIATLINEHVQLFRRLRNKMDVRSSVKLSLIEGDAGLLPATAATGGSARIAVSDEVRHGSNNGRYLGPVDILGNPIVVTTASTAGDSKERLFQSVLAAEERNKSADNNYRNVEIGHSGDSGGDSGGNSQNKFPGDKSVCGMIDSGGNSDGDYKRSEANNGRNWRAIKYSMGVLFATVCTFAIGGLVFVLGRPQVIDGDVINDDDDDEVTIGGNVAAKMPPLVQYFQRTWRQIQNYMQLLREPSRDKLLPDVLTAPYYQPPYTLVLEFTDLLVHPEWTYETGWRFKKRPGLDQFLEALYTRFEVVVYTAQMGMTVFPILDTLDPQNLISYKLVRDATHFVDGHHVKDLDRLNRDLRKVVVVDWNANSVKLHPNNHFLIARWTGNDDDTTLYDLAAFLLAISEWEIEDVQSVLKYYAQFENPLAKFKEAQMQVLQSSQY